MNPPTWITPKGGQVVNRIMFEDSNEVESKVSQPQNKWKSLEEARKLAKECRQKVDDSK